MKLNKSRFVLAILLSALVLTAAGCSKDKKDESSSVDDALLKQPFTFSYGEQNKNNSSDDSGDSSSQKDELDNQDPTSPEQSSESVDDSSSGSQESSGGSSETPEPATEYINVTEPNGEPVTEYVPATDAQGEVQTDAEGEEETVGVPVTEAVTVPVEENTESEKVTESEEYTPAMDTANSFWFDITTEEDYKFNGEFISVTFRIKDKAPDGVYEIDIINPDFANYSGQTVYPDSVTNPKIYVSKPKEEASAAKKGFSVYADSVEGKQGDEVTVVFSIKENPGVCAMIFEFQYDKNALEIVEKEASGEFAEIAGGSLT